MHINVCGTDNFIAPAMETGRIAENENITLDKVDFGQEFFYLKNHCKKWDKLKLSTRKCTRYKDKYNLIKIFQGYLKVPLRYLIYFIFFNVSYALVFLLKTKA